MRLARAWVLAEALCLLNRQQALARDLFHSERDQGVVALEERFDSAECNTRQAFKAWCASLEAQWLGPQKIQSKQASALYQ